MGAFGCEDVGYTESVRDNKFTTTTAARLCVRDLQGAQSSANRQKRQRQINECVFLPLLFHLIPPRPPIFLPSLIIVIIIPLTRFVWLYQTTWGAEKTHGSREPSTSRPIIHTAYGIRYTDCQRRALPPPLFLLLLAPDVVPATCLRSSLLPLVSLLLLIRARVVRFPVHSDHRIDLLGRPSINTQHIQLEG